MNPLENLLGTRGTTKNIISYLKEKDLFLCKEVWDSNEHSTRQFMPKCGKLGLSLTAVQTRTQGAWAAITSVDFDSRGHRADPEAVIFTPDGPGDKGTFPAKGSQWDVFHESDCFPAWGGGPCLYLGRLDMFSDHKALFYSRPYANSYDIPQEKGHRDLDVIRIKVFKLTKKPPCHWTASFQSHCRNCFYGNQFIPVDEVEVADCSPSGIARPLKGVVSVHRSEQLKANNPIFIGVDSIALSYTVEDAEVVGAMDELAEIFHDNPPTPGGLNRPHTLILKEPNDNLIKALTSSGTVKGIARLVVEKVEDMNAMAESLENVELFEEVVLKGSGSSEMNLRRFIQSSQKFLFKQIDPQPSYDQPPEELGKKIKAVQKKVEPLVELSMVNKSECAMVLRCSWGKVWPLRKDQMSRIGMLKKALETDGKESLDEAIPDAGLMVPTPGEEATTLAKHFLEVVGESDATSEENLWPASFESFFAQHLEPCDESDSEARKCCWLLAEMWGIACYLEIADLRSFCRSSWVLLTGGGGGGGGDEQSRYTTATSGGCDASHKRSKRGREDE